MEKTRIPHIKLTMLLKNGVMAPSFTAPCVFFMNVANVRNVPKPAPVKGVLRGMAWLEGVVRGREVWLVKERCG